MTRYPKTLAALRVYITADYPEPTPREMPATKWRLKNRMLAEHVLWMCDRGEAMKDAEQAGRWIGWMLCMAEERLKLWDNDRSRALVRSDVFPDERHWLIAEQNT